jgi:hypothetical protein
MRPFYAAQHVWTQLLFRHMSSFQSLLAKFKHADSKLDQYSLSSPSSSSPSSSNATIIERLKRF